MKESFKIYHARVHTLHGHFMLGTLLYLQDLNGSLMWGMKKKSQNSLV